MVTNRLVPTDMSGTQPVRIRALVGSSRRPARSRKGNAPFGLPVPNLERMVHKLGHAVQLVKVSWLETSLALASRLGRRSERTSGPYRQRRLADWEQGAPARDPRGRGAQRTGQFRHLAGSGSEGPRPRPAAIRRRAGSSDGARRPREPLDPAAWRRLDFSWDGAVVLQRLMRTRAVVIGHVGSPART
jgi:hypothetical protein